MAWKPFVWILEKFAGHRNVAELYVEGAQCMDIEHIRFCRVPIKLHPFEARFGQPLTPPPKADE